VDLARSSRSVASMCRFGEDFGLAAASSPRSPGITAATAGSSSRAAPAEISPVDGQ
jgi:hypothetical protein